MYFVVCQSVHSEDPQKERKKERAQVGKKPKDYFTKRGGLYILH